jgi:hypothetical protein
MAYQRAAYLVRGALELEVPAPTVDRAEARSDGLRNEARNCMQSTSVRPLVYMHACMHACRIRVLYNHVGKNVCSHVCTSVCMYSCIFACVYSRQECDSCMHGWHAHCMGFRRSRYRNSEQGAGSREQGAGSREQGAGSSTVRSFVF